MKIQVTEDINGQKYVRMSDEEQADVISVQIKKNIIKKYHEMINEMLFDAFKQGYTLGQMTKGVDK